MEVEARGRKEPRRREAVDGWAQTNHEASRKPMARNVGRVERASTSSLRWPPLSPLAAPKQHFRKRKERAKVEAEAKVKGKAARSGKHPETLMLFRARDDVNQGNGAPFYRSWAFISTNVAACGRSLSVVDKNLRWRSFRRGSFPYLEAAFAALHTAETTIKACQVVALELLVTTEALETGLVVLQRRRSRQFPPGARVLPALVLPVWTEPPPHILKKGKQNKMVHMELSILRNFWRKGYMYAEDVITAPGQRMPFWQLPVDGGDGRYTLYNRAAQLSLWAERIKAELALGKLVNADPIEESFFRILDARERRLQNQRYSRSLTF